MRDCLLSGFALFTDDPAAQEIEHCLKAHIKVSEIVIIFILFPLRYEMFFTTVKRNMCCFFNDFSYVM